MADGSGTITKGRIIGAHEASCPSVGELRAGETVVGCCDRCQVVDEVDVQRWRAIPRDAATPLSVLALQLRCLCGSRSVTLQVWPVAPHPKPRRRRFARWR
jgi:hypothetical protein